MTPDIINTINILAGISSIAISFIAIALSLTFYIAGRKTENRVSTSLAKIEAQTNALQKLSGKQIDKLMNHVFDGSASQSETMGQMIHILSQIPITITTILRQPIDNPNQVDQNQIIALYAALYFYTAQTNYWSQFYLPKANEFDSENPFHTLTRRIVDFSAADFSTIVNWLSKCDQALVEKNNLYNPYIKETIETWRHHVKSSADVFVATSQD
jgi:hypothetical protein